MRPSTVNKEWKYIVDKPDKLVLTVQSEQIVFYNNFRIIMTVNNNVMSAATNPSSFALRIPCEAYKNWFIEQIQNFIFYFSALTSFTIGAEVL